MCKHILWFKCFWLSLFVKQLFSRRRHENDRSAVAYDIGTVKSGPLPGFRSVGGGKRHKGGHILCSNRWSKREMWGQAPLPLAGS